MQRDFNNSWDRRALRAEMLCLARDMCDGGETWEYARSAMRERMLRVHPDLTGNQFDWLAGEVAEVIEGDRFSLNRLD